MQKVQYGCARHGMAWQCVAKHHVQDQVFDEGLVGIRRFVSNNLDGIVLVVLCLTLHDLWACMRHVSTLRVCVCVCVCV